MSLLPIEQFVNARKASAPLVAIKTPDPLQTMQVIMARFGENQPPMFRWDVAAGLDSLNEEGKTALPGIPGNTKSMIAPKAILDAVDKMPAKSILFLVNFHWFLSAPPTIQQIWNLRDQLKTDRRMLVILSPDIKIPSELSGDILVINEDLPTPDQLRRIVTDIYTAAQAAAPELADLAKREEDFAVSALSGLSSFPAEQAMAMSVTPTGLNLDTLWDRKARMVEQTQGLRIWQGGETFADVAGYENCKGFLWDVLEGEDPPNTIVFIDEVEKFWGGGGNDSSRVSTSLFGMFLSEIEDRGYAGITLIGAPGTGKSAIAKSLGGTGHIPTVQFLVSETQDSLVGNSEKNLREALKVIHGVSQGKALFIVTCNKIVDLPPEFRRRFSTTFFFDLPGAPERAAIWALYLKKFGLPEQPFPNDEGWTGSEIKKCCELAWKLRRTLLKAAEYVVPVSIAAAEKIQELRDGAHLKFLDASNPGTFDKNRGAKPTPTGRQMAITEELS